MLVDEKSLIHLEMLQWMDERLKQAKNNDQWFGGVHAAFFGDFYQLPPVKQADGHVALCEKQAERKADQSKSMKSEAWLSLNSYYKVDHNHRQEKAEKVFIEALRRARKAEAPLVKHKEFAEDPRKTQIRHSKKRARTLCGWGGGDGRYLRTG